MPKEIKESICVQLEEPLKVGQIMISGVAARDRAKIKPEDFINGFDSLVMGQKVAKVIKTVFGLTQGQIDQLALKDFARLGKQGISWLKNAKISLI